MYPSLDITAHRSPAPRHRWRPLWGMLAAWALFLVAPPAVRAHDHETEHEGHHATTSIPAGAPTITITDTLQPASLTVAPGTVIVFRNADDERHRMRPHSGPADFDTGNLTPGESATVVLTGEGTYLYFDHRRGHDHTAGYAGTIVVTSSASPPTGGGSQPPPPPATAPTTATVNLAGSAFTPKSVTIAAGGTVTWNNNDDRPHTVTANDTSFDSGILARGAAFQHRFPTAGTFSYVCDLHSGMTGTITVVPATGGTTPPPTTPPPTTPPPTTTPPSTTPPTTTPPATAPTTATVAIANNAFGPASVTIAVGGSVTWTNNDAQLHTATAGDNSWDSGILAKSGGTFTRAFATAGTYNYICSLHPEMKGTVVVVDAAGNAPPATTPPAETPPAGQQPTTTPAAQQPQASAPLPTLATVAMSGNQFGPKTIMVAIGGTVRWTNNDTVPHTVTAGDTSFDSGLIAKGGTFERIFSAAGTYAYECAFHAGMTGVVVAAANVTAAAAAAKAPAKPKAKPATKKKPTVNAPAKAPTTTRASGAGRGAGTGGATAPASASVSMKGSTFGPKTATIRPGGTVTWINDDTVPHTVTANDGSFDSGLIAPGGRYERTFASATTVSYRCTFHPGMVGTVTVAASATAAPSRAASPPTTSAPAPATHTRAPVTGSTQATAPTAATTGGGATSTATVTVGDNTFAPAHLTITAGTKVTFTNTGKLPHTVTATDKSFDSKIIPPGAKWSWTFTKAGTFGYDCIIHPGMSGSVTVTAAAAPAIGQAGGAPPSTATAGSGAAATPVATATQASGAARTAALIVASIVLGVGGIYLVGVLIAEEAHWRHRARRLAEAVGRFALGFLGRIRHPIRPRGRLRLRLH